MIVDILPWYNESEARADQVCFATVMPNRLSLIVHIDVSVDNCVLVSFL